MKKFLLYVLAGIVLIFLSYKIYVGYHKAKATNDILPYHTEKVIVLNSFELIKTMAVDYFGNSSFYSSSRKAVKEEDETTNYEGVDFPFKVLLYTVEDLPEAYFTTLQLSDVDAFEASLTAKDVAIENETSYKMGYIEKSKLLFAWNDTYLVISYHKKEDREKVTSVFNTILKDKKFLTDSEFLDTIEEANEHLAYIEKANEKTIRLHFLDGEIAISGMYKNDKVDFGTKHSYYEMPNETVAHLWFNVEDKTFIDELSESTIFKKLTIDKQLIKDHLKGYSDLTLYNQMTFQNDSIITYEYDDNFEKVPVVSIDRKRVPELTARFKVTDSTLLKSLIKQEKIVNGIFKPFPLYQLKTSQKEQMLSLSNAESTTQGKQLTSDSFFKATVDLEKLVALDLIPFLEDVNNMQIGTISGKQSKKGEVEIAGKVTFVHKDINALGQLFVKE